ncbi:baculoviral IAP repeat-containing protein 7-A-like [Penaeus monodon]|uniref:baculoviral IAP repeat-containing protein 7-A-like n=1 Tax=Penaeus monodon TaxID=6687 RepID=UPI0018A7A7B3|nr:baculoviral IAP repeat-containing protein 7-A-like [Penaeus monodon]
MSQNIPLHIDDQQYHVDFSGMTSEYNRRMTFGHESSSYVINPKILAKAGFMRCGLSSKQYIVCVNCHLYIDIDTIMPWDDIVKIHKDKNPLCLLARNLPPLPRSKIFENRFDPATGLPADLRYEIKRLETFIDWPNKVVQAKDLAAAGFFYTRDTTCCICFSCHKYMNFSYDKPIVIRDMHLKKSPNCKFAQGKSVGNIPIRMSNILNSIVNQKRVAVTSATATATATATVDQEDLIKTRYEYAGPLHDYYKTTQSRLESFLNWPHRHRQKIEALVEAGFYYLGISDHVQCFHCGACLRNWEEDDDPWRVHAEWYPECYYVQLKKGKEFIDKVRLEVSRIPMWRHSSSTSQDTSEHDWNILLGLDYTKRLILVQGFPVVAVRDALCEQILQTGIPFSREVDCTSAVRKKIESYEEKNNNKLLTAERIANYRTVYAVMRFIQMVMGKSYNRSYPTGCIENSVYLYKQSAFNDSGDPNIPMYRHEISFNLPYPDHTYTGYHIESEYRMTLDRLNSYEITSRISSILDQEQSASLTAIWG